jgi:hypothetical protein
MRKTPSKLNVNLGEHAAIDNIENFVVIFIIQHTLTGHWKFISYLSNALFLVFQ